MQGQLNRSVVLSLVVPVFCEEEHLAESIGVIHAAVQGLDEPFEIVIVDDGSKDDTWEAVQQLAARLPAVRGLRLSRNFGKEGAIRAGIESSRGEAVLVMDCDLQHPPEMIARMFQLWRQGHYKVVNAVKRRANRPTWSSRIGAHGFYRLFQLATGIDLVGSSDFKLIDREVANAYLHLTERKLFFRGMIAWLGYPQADLDFEVEHRVAGHSKWSTFRLFRLAIDSLVSFSGALMHVITVLGAAFLLLALVLGAHTAWCKLSGQAVEGFTTVILLLLIMGSTIMLSLGVIGEYIARIHLELQHRPRHLVSETTEMAESQGLRVYKEAA